MSWLAVGTLGGVRAPGLPSKGLGDVLPPGLPILGLREGNVVGRECCQGLSGVLFTLTFSADLGVSAELVCMAAPERNFTFPPVPSAMEVTPGKRSSCIRCSRAKVLISSPRQCLHSKPGGLSNPSEQVAEKTRASPSLPGTLSPLTTLLCVRQGMASASRLLCNLYATSWGLRMFVLLFWARERT